MGTRLVLILTLILARFVVFAAFDHKVLPDSNQCQGVSKSADPSLTGLSIIDNKSLPAELLTIGNGLNHQLPYNGDTSINKRLLKNLTIGIGTLYAGSVFGLYQLWYRDYEQGNFHFYNDNGEWMQIDKAGHATSAYYIGMVGFEALSATGISNNKAALIGGSLGLVYLTTVEIFDGFSAGWGASYGDVIANLTGTAAFISQQLCWKEQRILFRYSYHPTKYAAYRPDLLGSNAIQSALKDYNGHTYWLSGNIKSFLPEHSTFPAWINIAAGYSGTGMLGAYSNPSTHNGMPLPAFERYRRYYISPDIDFSKLKVNNKTVGYLIKALSFIKIPMPAIEFNKKGIRLHPLYF